MLLGVGGREEWAPEHDRTAAIFLKIGNPNTPYGMDAALSLNAIMSPSLSIRTTFLPVRVGQPIAESKWPLLTSPQWAPPTGSEEWPEWGTLTRSRRLG